MTKDIPQGVLNMMRDRALYEVAVTHGLFERGRGHLEEKLPDGTWKVTDWRERPEVRALSDAPEVAARMEAMRTTWVNRYRTQAEEDVVGVPDSGTAAIASIETLPLSDAADKQTLTEKDSVNLK